MNRPAIKISTIYLVIFALIFNAITSTVAFGGTGGGPNEVLLCTSSGYKWVNIDDLPTSEQNTQQHCKLCLFPPSDDNSDDFILPSSTAIKFSLSDNKLSASPNASIKTRFTYLVAHSRAPPTFYSPIS